MKPTVMLMILVLFGCKSVRNNANSSDEIIVEIAPERLDCKGIAPQKCLKIREQGSKDWELFYDNIEGFNFIQGFQYTLKVKKTKINNPPADASAIQYSLVEVITFEEKDISGSFNNYPKLTVTKIENGKDGYTTHLLDDGKMTYTMEVRIPNLGDNYIDLKVGDSIRAYGDYAESIPVRIYVRMIKKL